MLLHRTTLGLVLIDFESLAGSITTDLRVYARSEFDALLEDIPLRDAKRLYVLHIIKTLKDLNYLYGNRNTVILVNNNTEHTNVLTRLHEVARVLPINIVYTEHPFSVLDQESGEATEILNHTRDSLKNIDISTFSLRKIGTFLKKHRISINPNMQESRDFWADFLGNIYFKKNQPELNNN